MAKSPADVVWLSPESLVVAARRAWVADHPDATPDETLTAIQDIEAANANGQYRVMTASGPVGPLYVWVDEAPDDPESSVGHFAAYKPTADQVYDPQPVASAVAQAAGPITKDGGAGSGASGGTQ